MEERREEDIVLVRKSPRLRQIYNFIRGLTSPTLQNLLFYLIRLLIFCIVDNTLILSPLGES